MNNTLPGCLLLLAAFAGGFLMGFLAASAVGAVTGDKEVAGAVGTGVLILSVVLFMSYGSLLLYRAGLIRDDTPSTSARQQWRKRREESKLQTAELRVGLIFGAVSGGCAHYGGASTGIIIVFALAAGALGALIGHDIKRRARALREEKREESDEDVMGDPHN